MSTNLKQKIEQKEEENEFSFRELLIKSSNYLPLFAIFLIISLAIAVVYIHFQTPIYSSSVKLLLKDSKKGGASSDLGLADILNTSRVNLSNEIEVLKSVEIMERVVTHQQLNTVYYSVGKVNTLELFLPNPQDKFIRFSIIKDSSQAYSITIQVDEGGKIYKIDGKKRSLIQNHLPIVTPQYTYVVNVNNPQGYKHDYKYTATWLPTPVIAGSLAGSLGISPLSKDATILVINTSSQVPAKSEVVLNSLVSEYNSYNIEQNNVISNNTIQFINDRLLFISNELNDVENNLKDFKQNNALDIEVEGTNEVEGAKKLEEQLNDQELQMNVADMVSTYINNPQRKYELVPSNLGIGDATLTGLIGSYNEGVIKRQEMLKTLGEKNLQVTTLENQLDDYRNKIAESVNNVKAVYNKTYNSTNQQYKSTLANIQSIPAKEKQLLEIERQQGIKEKLYLYLLEKREEAAVSRAAAIGKSEAVDVAVSWGPINFNNSNIYLMALFAGLGVPFLIVYLMDLLNDKLTTRQEVLKLTDTPIIGEISHFSDQERKIVVNKPRGILPEQFRLVRTNLRYFLPKHKASYCMLVTSTMPGEGKTFISLNFAAVLAAPGKKTILIEFDMRRPKVSESLGLERNNNDLPAFLSGTVTPDKIIRKAEGNEFLYVITTSYVPPNPAELLLSDKLDILFKYLKENFDYIIIDTPPLGLVSDAKVLGEYADLSLYVIRQRFTKRKQVKMVEELYKEKKMPNLALVVNDVKVKGMYNYYGYGYYGSGDYSYDYSLGYTSYGYSNKKKEGWLKRLLKR